jgi:hypothetical protein
MNVTSFQVTNYGDSGALRLRKDKAKQTQFQDRTAEKAAPSLTAIMQNKANFQDTEMNVTSFQVRDYGDSVALRLRKNKAKTNPISKSRPQQATRRKSARKRFRGTGAGNDGDNNQAAERPLVKKNWDFFDFFQILVDLSSKCANIYDYEKKNALNILSVLWVADADRGYVLYDLWGQDRR